MIQMENLTSRVLDPLTVVEVTTINEDDKTNLNLETLFGVI